jgi:hypothetical protein
VLIRTGSRLGSLAEEAEEFEAEERVDGEGLTQLAD